MRVGGFKRFQACLRHFSGTFWPFRHVGFNAGKQKQILFSPGLGSFLLAALRSSPCVVWLTQYRQHRHEKDLQARSFRKVNSGFISGVPWRRGPNRLQQYRFLLALIFYFRGGVYYTRDQIWNNVKICSNPVGLDYMPLVYGRIPENGMTISPAARRRHTIRK